MPLRTNPAPPTKIQSLIFDRDHFSPEAARAWARNHGFDRLDVDEKTNTLRLRQARPTAMTHLRTIPLADGVQAVIGHPELVRHNPESDMHNTILEASARAAFVTEWANEEEASGRTYGGMDLMDVAPETSDAARAWAKKLWEKIVELELTRGKSWGPAAASLKPSIESLWAHTAKAAGLDATDEEAREFGHYVAMQAMGHGVSWADDHPDLDFKVPHMEAYDLLPEGYVHAPHENPSKPQRSAFLRHVECDECGGSGHYVVAGTKYKCRFCDGTGKCPRENPSKFKYLVGQAVSYFGSEGAVPSSWKGVITTREPNVDDGLYYSVKWTTPSGTTHEGLYHESNLLVARPLNSDADQARMRRERSPRSNPGGDVSGGAGRSMTRDDRPRGWFHLAVGLTPELRQGAPVRLHSWQAKGSPPILVEAIIDDPSGRQVIVDHPTWALVSPGTESEHPGGAARPMRTNPTPRLRLGQGRPGLAPTQHGDVILSSTLHDVVGVEDAMPGAVTISAEDTTVRLVKRRQLAQHALRNLRPGRDEDILIEVQTPKWEQIGEVDGDGTICWPDHKKLTRKVKLAVVELLEPPWTTANTSAEHYAERDNVVIRLLDARGKAIIDVSDDEARELVADGFVDPRNLHVSLCEYANRSGATPK